MSFKRPDFKKPSQFFLTVTELYDKRLNYLIQFAKSHLYQGDFALDAVHNAVMKSIEYFAKPENVGRKVYIRNVEYSILRECKRHNKLSSIEKAVGLMGINGEDESDGD